MKKKYLIIHCTDTPKGMHVTADDIRRWHTSEKPYGRGWKQVGYRRMYHLNGDIEDLIASNGDDTVDTWEITNGAKGYNNISDHFVYVGGHGGDTRTDMQLLAMAKDIKEYNSLFPDVKIIGHNEVSNKTCPSFNVQEWLKEIGINQ